MKYEDIKELTQRCEEHPDHQSGMISYGMIQQRLQEEIDELREYIEQRQFVELTDDEVREVYGIDWAYKDGDYARYARAIEAKLKEKNT